MWRQFKMLPHGYAHTLLVSFAMWQCASVLLCVCLCLCLCVHLQGVFAHCLCDDAGPDMYACTCVEGYESPNGEVRHSRFVLLHAMQQHCALLCNVNPRLPCLHLTQLCPVLLLHYHHHHHHGDDIGIVLRRTATPLTRARKTMAGAVPTPTANTRAQTCASARACPGTRVPGVTAQTARRSTRAMKTTADVAMP